MTVPILLLAGGNSSRMGKRDKLTELVGKHPLVRVQAWRALKASRDVTVLLRPGNHAAKRALAGLDVRIIQPTEAFEGMGGSLRAGTRYMLRSRAFMMILADLIDIEAVDIKEVIKVRTRHPHAAIVRGATEDGQPGHPIIFDRVTYGNLLNVRRDEGGRAVAEHFKSDTHLVPLPGNKARFDLDTPEAWDAWHSKQADHHNK